MTSIRRRWQLGLALAVCVAVVPASSRAAGPAPTITVQPDDQTGYVSETVTFVAGAKGKKPLAFQWYRNGTAISGATSETLQVQVQSPAQNGTLFYAVVSNSNGSAQTRNASLKVHQAIPVGVWTFDNPSDLTAATVGLPLTLFGSQTVATGPAPGNGAVLMSAGNYYAMTHQISPNGGGTKVNEWTLMMDIQVPVILSFNSMFQTNPTNSDDGDCFVAADGSVGVGATGYSDVAITAIEWHRMVVVVRNGITYDIYDNAKRILQGTPSAIDGRMSIASQLLLFADDDGEHADMNVAEVRMYDHALTSTEVNELGGFRHATNIQPIGPYLQNVTTTGITIMWESTEPTPNTVEYGLTTAYDSQQVATMQAMRDGMWLHKAVLTGLAGATSYHYRLVTRGKHALDHTFKTAPSPTANFTFAVWGDSQGTTDENLIDPLEPTKALMHHLAEVEQVDMAVAVGDMAENGDNTPAVRRYFLNRAADIVGSKLPFYIAWGNHDGPEGAIIRSYVDLPGPRSYSFDYGGVHFICADYFDTQKDITDFVKADLQSPAAAQARFIFFFIHTAPYYERWYEGEKWLRSKIVPLLEKHQVAISFSGHMHGYERGLLNGVNYVTTGGGSWLDAFEPLVRDWPHITVGGFSSSPPSPINNGIVNEYVKVEITGDTATVKTFGFAPEGQSLGEIDRFIVTSP